MFKKICLSVLALVVILMPVVSFAQANSIEYLCEIGKIYYDQGLKDEAIAEFRKVLLLDEHNVIANSYIEKVASERKKIWDAELDKLVGKKPVVPKIIQQDNRKDNASKAEEEPALKISGEVQASYGQSSQGGIWKSANGDLNERNWRILSSAALNRQENTYDPRIFDRMRVNLDTPTDKQGLGMHSNITVDPWSFTGKSEKRTISTGAVNGDLAEIELKYWSNTGYTINETVFTLKNGAAISLPEIKVNDGELASSIPVTNTWGEAFTIPKLKIQREFQPLRELWLDYRTDKSNLRFFPMAYSDQALSSDDPLQLSNHHIYWEESPWILRWAPGHLNSAAGISPDFFKGRWDDSLAFFTRDSDMVRLTALRGLSFNYYPTDETSIAVTGASPKTLWQEYDSFDNFPVAMRLKQRVGEKFLAGLLYSYRLGLNEENKKDAVNHVQSADFSFSPVTGAQIQTQVAFSRSKQDLTAETYATNKQGLAYQVAFIGSPEKDILGANYNTIQPDDEINSLFFKTRLHWTHMDRGFEPALSSYRETRDDQFWSRHIHFRKPFKNFYGDSDYDKSSLSFENDILPYAIGDGIDIGRDVIGLRLEGITAERKLEQLFDVRNVHRTGGKYLENVGRSETTFRPTKKLTTKLLAIYHNVHKTYGAKDPYLVDAQTDRVVDNAIIQDGKDPSMKTFSLGGDYEFFEWMSLYGIYEYSNDINGAYDAFGRGTLNSGSFETYSDFNRIFRRQTAFVYNQQYFPRPPYHFNSAYKTGLTLRPIDKMEVFLDYTRNEYEYAGQISDDINHAGMEINYQLTEKFGAAVSYAYSKVKDLIMMNNGQDVRNVGHHSFFTETRFRFSADDRLVFQYGVSNRGPKSTVAFDPFGGSLAVLDTQHIWRMYYTRKF